MTPEELLLPRIKCVIRYPDSPFPMGAILEQDFEEPEIYNYTDSNRRPWMIENPGLYPEVFQPLQWWEDRKPEDMPKYFKVTGIGVDLNDEGNYVYRIGIDAEWDYYQGNAIRVKYRSGGGTLTEYVRPSTEQEYLEYIKQKEG